MLYEFLNFSRWVSRCSVKLMCIKNDKKLSFPKELISIVFEQWDISDTAYVGACKANQGEFLDFHREVLFFRVKYD